jgi:small-conductance mechanosensitive channel
MIKDSLLSWSWWLQGGWMVGATRLVLAVVILIAAFTTARLVRVALDRVKGRTHLSGPIIYIFQKLTSYALIAIGILVALSTLGIDLTSLAVFAGAVGVGVGLGLQGIVREFVSGLVVIFDQHLHVGDFVELEGGVKGEIVEVGPRAARIRTNDAVDVVLPNSKLIETKVENWTLHGETRRIHVPFTVAYGADKNQVRDAVLAAARALPFTLPDTDARRTQVWMVGFGDSALNFELVVWPTQEAARRPAAMHAAYTWAIDEALRSAEVEMPFPQLDVRLRSLFGRETDDALAALRLERVGDVRPAARASAHTNDAMQDTQISAHADDPEGRSPTRPRSNRSDSDR